jgi:tetratricopeptide (TPR) repeat protein
LQRSNGERSASRSAPPNKNGKSRAGERRSRAGTTKGRSTPRGLGDGPVLRAKGELRARASGRRAKDLGTTTLVRFSLATFLRVTDNFIASLVALYDKVFALDQKDEGKLYLEMGRDLAQDGRTDEALGAFRKATRLQPEDAHGWIEIGKLHLSRHAPEAAIKALRTALELDASNAQVHAELAEALTQQEKHEEAIIELERAVAVDPESSECWYRIGLLRDKCGNFSEAVDAFGKAVELAPEKVGYRQRLGFSLESLGRREDAIQCFKLALEMETSAKR